MFVLIIGASASGKSEYAESVCMTLSKNNSKLYIATMQPFGQDAKFRINRHRELRKNKGFHSLERYTNLHDCLSTNYNTILLECMSNLLANEMFNEETHFSQDSILSGIDYIKSNCKNLVVVTNQVFSDNTIYDNATNEYIQKLGTLNIELAKKADVVCEVVCGIPIKLKGELK